MDIRRKTLDIVLDLVSPKNVEDVVMLLKKEIQKTQSKEIENASEYRQLLIQSIHTCAVKYPDVAANVIHTLMDFLGDMTSSSSAVDVILFVREVMESYPNLRPSLLKKLLDNLILIKSGKVFRGALWILGQYSENAKEIDKTFTVLKENLGTLPLFTEEEETPKPEKTETSPATTTTTTTTTASSAKSASAKQTSHKPLVTSDGSYATQSAMAPASSGNSKEISKATGPSLRNLIMSGDFFLAVALSYTLTKLYIKCRNDNTLDQITKNLIQTEVLVIMTSIVRYGTSSKTPHTMDSDSQERMTTFMKILMHESIGEEVMKISHEKFVELMKEQQKQKQPENKGIEVKSQVDDLLKIRQLQPKKLFEGDDFGDDDVSKLSGLDDKKKASDRLKNIFQLTGYSDPIFAEAFVDVHKFDIVLEVTVMNQTPETLQNVALELSTLGDLKLVERPSPVTIAPHDKKVIRTAMKVSSTESGTIFGNIVYDVAGAPSSDKNCVVLNEIHIDVMDYIVPANCTDLQFRKMWTEFEWENKVAVNTNITDISAFLQHLIKTTNMKCLTPQSLFQQNCGFLSANLYAKSIFGEDALANISIENQPDGKIVGFVRIRSKTQGIALSLGDKISMKQRSEDKK